MQRARSSMPLQSKLNTAKPKSGRHLSKGKNSSNHLSWWDHWLSWWPTDLCRLHIGSWWLSERPQRRLKLKWGRRPRSISCACLKVWKGCEVSLQGRGKGRCWKLETYFGRLYTSSCSKCKGALKHLIVEQFPKSTKRKGSEVRSSKWNRWGQWPKPKHWSNLSLHKGL